MCGTFELVESFESMLNAIKAVNDSIHQVNIRGLPEVLHPLGSLICQESFSVLTENKSQSQILFRNSKQRRHVLLYENHLIFCKQMSEKGATSYQFKFSLTVANLGMSSIIEGEEKKWKFGFLASQTFTVYKGKQRRQKMTLQLSLGK